MKTYLRIETVRLNVTLTGDAGTSNLYLLTGNLNGITETNADNYIYVHLNQIHDNAFNCIKIYLSTDRFLKLVRMKSLTEKIVREGTIFTYSIEEL